MNEAYVDGKQLGRWEMTNTGGGASPDVCPRASGTLATPLQLANQKCHFALDTLPNG